MTKKKHFTGPIFIVGVSRSGTKLLRDLLNNHPDIGIPVIESKFIPSFYKKYGKREDLRIRNNFTVFYKDFTRTVFFQEMTQLGKTVTEETWYSSIETWTFEDIIHTLFVILARQEGKNIWGDKTPNYLIYIPILNCIFPHAKFIHIYRDARDVCLSAQKAWNRNIYYSAQRWFDYITMCRKDACSYLKGNYFELKYEDLITQPALILRNICDFIGIQFQEEMCTIEKSSEPFGSAKGKNIILENNREKWRATMTPRQVKKVEKICGTLLDELGYPLSHPLQGKPYRLNPFVIVIYRFLETWHLFLSHLKEKNIAAAFRAVSRKIQTSLPIKSKQ